MDLERKVFVLARFGPRLSCHKQEDWAKEIRRGSFSLFSRDESGEHHLARDAPLFLSPQLSEEKMGEFLFIR